MITQRDRVFNLIIELRSLDREKDADALVEMLKGRDLAMREVQRLMKMTDTYHDEY